MSFAIGTENMIKRKLDNLLHYAYAILDRITLDYADENKKLDNDLLDEWSQFIEDVNSFSRFTMEAAPTYHDQFGETILNLQNRSYELESKLEDNLGRKYSRGTALKFFKPNITDITIDIAELKV